jgi:hypothetical protein
METTTKPMTRIITTGALTRDFLRVFMLLS